MTRKRLSGWKRFAGFKFALGALIIFQSSFILAQTSEATKPVSEVEQLKQRLLQLEQTVVELKGQSTAIEDTKKQTPAPAIVQATYSDSSACVETAAPAAPNPQDSKEEGSFTTDGFAT